MSAKMMRIEAEKRYQHRDEEKRIFYPSGNRLHHLPERSLILKESISLADHSVFVCDGERERGRESKRGDEREGEWRERERGRNEENLTEMDYRIQVL